LQRLRNADTLTRSFSTPSRLSYYKSKLDLKSNSSEILSVNCKLIYDSAPTETDKTQTLVPQV